MTYVFEGFDYVFFMNEDFTARYDGFPVAALPVTDELVAAVQRGYCMGEDSLQQNCGKIKSLYSQNSPNLSINISKFIIETISIFLKSVIFAVISVQASRVVMIRVRKKRNEHMKFCCLFPARNIFLQALFSPKYSLQSDILDYSKIEGVLIPNMIFSFFTHNIYIRLLYFL